MSIVISATSVIKPDPETNGVQQAARAGLECLSNASLTVEDVDFLVNVGVYRYQNTCEPAVCAMIQHEMGMCLDPRKTPVKKNVFSFDLTNGACGVLSSILTLGAMLNARQCEHALIVGIDCPPSEDEDPNFPINPMAGAFLLSRSAESGRGFGPVWLRTSPETFDGQQGSCDLSVHGTDSRDKVDVVREPNYIPRLVSFASEVVNAYLDEHQCPREALLLVCSQPSATFATDLAEAIGLPASALVSTFEQYGDTHTSSLAVGHQMAQAKGLLEGQRVLFVEAGAGLTVGCTVYT